MSEADPALANRPADARVIRTRAALQRALLALIQHKAFDQLTIRDIVAEAGIGYATFFRHYPSKEALLDDVAAEEIGQLVNLSAPALTEQGSRASALALCRYVYDHRGLWAALLTGGAAAAMREELIRQSRNNVAKVEHDGWLPTDLGLVHGVSATFEILAWWLRQPEAYSVEQVAEFFDRLVLTPTVGRG